MGIILNMEDPNAFYAFNTYIFKILGSSTILNYIIFYLKQDNIHISQFKSIFLNIFKFNVFLRIKVIYCFSLNIMIVVLKSFNSFLFVITPNIFQMSKNLL